MRTPIWRVLRCCLVVLLTACANTPAQPHATATLAATTMPQATATMTRAEATAGAVVAAAFARSAPSAANTPTPEAARVPTIAVALGDEFATVVRVLDGATIEVRLADGRLETVRYLGIATTDPSACYGTEATARNRALVEGKRVRLERDVSTQDRYERPLRYVWVMGDDGTTRLANVELVRSGDAAAAIQPPDVRYQQRFLDAEIEAREAGRGLWQLCAGSPTPGASATALATPPPPTPTPQVPTRTPQPPAPPPAAPPPALTATPLPPPPAAAPTATAPRTATPQPALPTPAQPAATATRVPPPPPTPTRVPPTPTKLPTPVPQASCHPSYPTLCLPASPDLDCADIPQRNFPVKPPDPHHLDGDHDGIGCES